MISRHIKVQKENTKRIKHRHKHKQNGKKKVIVLCSIIIVVVILFDLALRPSVNKAIAYQSNVIATNIMSDVTYKVLDELSIDYDQIVQINKDKDGNIIGIETDIVSINKLKSILTTEITSKFNDQKTYPYSISLGTMIGSDYLTGHGPDISLRIEPTGYLQTELVSKFTSVGINQTHHQIILNMTADITTIVPLHNSTTKILTNFVVAETIIVGNVPQYYTNVISDDKSLMRDINDYGYNRFRE